MAISTSAVELNGAGLYVEATGTGPAVVLVHGFALDGRMWDAQIAAFAADYTVIRYDLRGFGRSPVPHARYTHVADLRRILAELGIPRAAIVGLSLGGQVAVDFALAYPAATAALITVDAALSGFHWSPDFAASLGAIVEIGRALGIDAARASLEGPRIV